MSENECPVAEYRETAAALSELREKFHGVVYPVETTAGLRDAVQARAELRSYRTSLEKTRREIKAPALERCRQIDDEAKRITAVLVSLEDPIDAQIKAEEGRKEAIRQAKEQAERERVAAIQSRIAEIVGLPVTAVAWTAEKIVEYIDTVLEPMPVGTDEFAEFAEQALAAKTRSIEMLESLLATKRSEAAEKERIAAERAELARQREEEERMRREVRAAEEARMAEERAAHDAMMRAEREQAKREAEEQRQALAKEAAEVAAARAEVDRISSEQQEREAVEQASIAAAWTAEEAAEQAHQEREAHPTAMYGAPADDEKALQEQAIDTRVWPYLDALERDVKSRRITLREGLARAYEAGRESHSENRSNP